METDRALPDDLRYRPPGGPRLAEFLDGLRVENYWLKGHHIVWQTGQQNAPNGLGRASHSHCSAFVTAAAQYLGIYVLRPPYHDEVLLASAQDHWFKGYRRFQGPAAEASGWRKVGQSGAPGSLMLAVDAANAGKLVVASYAQRPTHDPVSGEPVYHPGHVAIIRPTNAPAPPWATELVPGNWTGC